MRAVTRILCPVDLLDAYKAKITALHVRNPLVVPETDVRVFGFGPPLVLTDDEKNEARAQVLACFGSAGADVDVVITAAGRSTGRRDE